MAVTDLLTPKQARVLKSYLIDDWKILILNGAVRSGKTFINNFIFMYEMKRVKALAEQEGEPNPKYILAGFSNGTIKTNVLSELENTFGIELKPDRNGHYNIFGVEIVPAYTGNERGMRAIRGMTSYGAYINETSLSTQSVFTEIVNRCSKKGARIICDTNPDNPEHWLKKNYIDNASDAARIKSFRFTLDDNTFLPEDYVSSLKASTPTGMFYDRAILGLWVSGDGVVYQDFNEKTMVKKGLSVPRDALFYAGVDWGYEHLGSIVVMADYGGSTYLLEEDTEQYKEIDYWVTRAKQVKAKYGNIRFYADSARPEHVARFNREGIHCINANKSILSGIEEVASLMKQGRFYVDASAHEFLNEVYEYIWDEKTGMPVKKHDDCMDAVRYAIYSQHHKSVNVRTFKY